LALRVRTLQQEGRMIKSFSLAALPGFICVTHLLENRGRRHGTS
jgi:hypothetical protein